MGAPGPGAWGILYQVPLLGVSGVPFLSCAEGPPLFSDEDMRSSRGDQRGRVMGGREGGADPLQCLCLLYSC